LYEEGEETGVRVEMNAEDDSWKNVWSKMRESGAGWKKKKGKIQQVGVSWGASRAHSIHDQDYFDTLQELQDYARKEYDWTESSGLKTSDSDRKDDKAKKTHAIVDSRKRGAQGFLRALCNLFASFIS
jgi:hypothetical protein